MGWVAEAADATEMASPPQKISFLVRFFEGLRMKPNVDCPRVSSTTARSRLQSGAVVMAALALPGVYSPTVLAEGAPEQGVIAFKYLRYEDSQPGKKRVTVDAPSVYLATPLGPNWSAEGSMVVDSVSGATPRWQSSVSGASNMSDERKAGDVKVTRHFERSSYALGLSHSSENDYVSNAFSVQGSWSTPDNNRTWTMGYGHAQDKINPTKGGTLGIENERKKTHEIILGVTQAVSSNDIAQLNLTLGSGKGYYSDPYKTLDYRPRERTQFALLGRWNHFLNGNGSTLRGSYRLYNDSFGIRAHTLLGEWVKPVTDALTLTPLLRFYSQSSADFYKDGQYDSSGIPIYPTLSTGELNSGDQRLSAFGAVSVGLKAHYKINPVWAVDGKIEAYEQRSSWRLGGSGSSGVDAFKASIVQMGVSHKF